MTLLHEEAIYLHQGIQYQVEKLDWEEKKAYVREVEVDYYTDANLAVQLKVLEEDKSSNTERGNWIMVMSVFLPWRRFLKRLNLKPMKISVRVRFHLPEEELHTSAAWISLNKDACGMSEERLDQGLVGMAHSLKSIAPLFVMCDPGDVHVVPQVKATHNEKPTIFFYDRYPGGIGLSEKIYERMETFLGKHNK